VDVVKGNVTDR